jgi:hypothetical protein
MKKYSAVDGCPKCGCLTTFDRYIENIQFGGRIRRKCTRCDYLWWNAPLDADENNKTYFSPSKLREAALAVGLTDSDIDDLIREASKLL